MSNHKVPQSPQNYFPCHFTIDLLLDLLDSGLWWIIVRLVGLQDMPFHFISSQGSHECGIHVVMYWCSIKSEIIWRSKFANEVCDGETHIIAMNNNQRIVVWWATFVWIYLGHNVTGYGLEAGKHSIGSKLYIHILNNIMPVCFISPWQK